MSPIILVITSLFFGLWIGVLLGIWITKRKEVKPLVADLTDAEDQIRAYEDEFVDLNKMLNIAVGFVKDHTDVNVEGMKIGQLALDAKATMDAIKAVRDV